MHITWTLRGTSYICLLLLNNAICLRSFRTTLVWIENVFIFLHEHLVPGFTLVSVFAIISSSRGHKKFENEVFFHRFILFHCTMCNKCVVLDKLICLDMQVNGSGTISSIKLQILFLELQKLARYNCLRKQFVLAPWYKPVLVCTRSIGFILKRDTSAKKLLTYLHVIFALLLGLNVWPGFQNNLVSF